MLGIQGANKRNVYTYNGSPQDFERMAADILNALGYREVVLIAPRGGSDSGKDITFTTESGGKGLACVTLRDDIQRKFEEDFLSSGRTRFSRRHEVKVNQH